MAIRLFQFNGFIPLAADGIFVAVTERGVLLPFEGKKEKKKKMKSCRV
jgi:hypothetical protein